MAQEHNQILDTLFQSASIVNEHQFAVDLKTSVPSAIVAATGWLSHTLATAKKLPSPRVIAGRMMLSGFIGWVGVVILQHMFSMEPTFAAACASIIGSQGENGYKLFRDLVERKTNG